MKKKEAHFVFNPLGQILSMFLRRERAMMDISSAEMGEKLQLSEAMVRMIEGARATFHPSKIFLILAAYNRLPVKFTMLAKFFAGYQYMQSLIESGVSGQESFQRLASQEQAFDVLYRKLHHFHDFQKLGTEQQIYIQERSPEMMEEFLTNEYYGNGDWEGDKRFEQRIKLALIHLPSLEADSAFQKIQDLQKRHLTPVLLDETLLRPYSSRIANLTVAIRFSNRIIDKQHFNRLPYSFLSSSSFKSMKIICLEQTRTPEELKTAFFKELKAARPDIAITEKAKTKVEFRIPNKLDYKNRIEETLLANVGEYKMLNSFWRFQLDTDNSLGFISAPEGNHDLFYNLNYVETEERSKNLNFFWNDLDIKWKQEIKKIQNPHRKKK